MAAPPLHVPTFHNGRSATARVEVSPAALLELVESLYCEMPGSTTKIVGTLLGSKSDDGSVVHVKGSYVVPLKEENGEFSFQDVYNNSTFLLHRKADPNVAIVGWFSTESTFDSYTGLVHDIYARTAPNPIFLTLDCKTNEGVGAPTVRTYTAAPVGLPASSNLVQTLGLDKSGAHVFVPVPNDVIVSRGEQASLGLVASGARTGVPAKPQPELAQVQASIKKSIEMVHTLRDYTARVQKGELTPNPKVAELLQATLKYKLGKDQLARFGQLVENRLDESVVLEYLASCLKQQLELSSKLTNLLLPEEALAL